MTSTTTLPHNTHLPPCLCHHIPPRTLAFFFLILYPLFATSAAVAAAQRCSSQPETFRSPCPPFTSSPSPSHPHLAVATLPFKSNALLRTQSSPSTTSLSLSFTSTPTPPLSPSPNPRWDPFALTHHPFLFDLDTHAHLQIILLLLPSHLFSWWVVAAAAAAMAETSEFLLVSS
ncbi:hypothetical protein FH972_002204 [Carpinus fangiana]|uniref:Uncharacterized protein n=1 Tax=Carpinus fangiana TaxID=176857 RepID=A0A5N6QHB7_9ROSI|nr:hypothetical protein FH972_002204 [Carpinus fangiana]